VNTLKFTRPSHHALENDRISRFFSRLLQLFKAGRARHFLRTAERSAKLPWSPFEKVLKREFAEFYMNATAIGIYAQLVEEASAAGVTVAHDVVTPLLKFVEQHLSKPDVESVRIGCIGLRPLLSNETYRRRYALGAGGVSSGLDALIKTLRTHAKSVQLVYEAAYCLWLLTFSIEVIAAAPESLVRALVDCVRTQKKEKVLRVCIAALTALCSAKRSEVRKLVAVVVDGDAPPPEPVTNAAAVAATAAADSAADAADGAADANGGEVDERQLEAQMIEAGEDVVAMRLRNAHCTRHAETALDAGLTKPLQTLRQRVWADDELAADLENLGRALARSERALSSFDEYKKEVLSGELDWTPPHKSETFWHENVQLFDEDDFRLVKTLKVLAGSENQKVASIACYDLGEFSRLHPKGRDILEQTGAKAVLIGLMSVSKNADVQKQALFAIQKLMVKKFDAVALST
jgi:hypothetical protein